MLRPSPPLLGPGFIFIQVQPQLLTEINPTTLTCLPAGPPCPQALTGKETEPYVVWGGGRGGDGDRKPLSVSNTEKGKG